MLRHNLFLGLNYIIKVDYFVEILDRKSFDWNCCEQQQQQRLYALHLPFITSRAFRQIMGHEERFEGAQDLNLTEQLQILDLPCLQGVTRNTITLISALRKQV